MDRTGRPRRVRPQRRDPPATPVPWPQAPPRRRGGDRPSLHRSVLERPDIHRQPGSLRHVLDARPGLQCAIAGPARARRPRPRLAVVRARRVGPPSSPHHDDHPLFRPAGRRLRIRRRLAAALPGRRARHGRDLPGRTPPPLARGRDRPLLRDGRRPDDRSRPVGPQVQRPPGHGRQPLERLRQHDGRAAGQDDRGDGLVRLALRTPLPRRLRPPADGAFLGRRSLP